jgi:hypothetical protein
MGAWLGVELANGSLGVVMTIGPAALSWIWPLNFELICMTALQVGFPFLTAMRLLHCFSCEVCLARLWSCPIL